MTGPIVRIATIELERVRELIAAHVQECRAPRNGPGCLTAECRECRSLAVHRVRCEEQVRLLASTAPAGEPDALF